MGGTWRVLVFALAVGVACVESDGGNTGGARLVQTAQGPVRGHKDLKTGVFTFYDIPYATAPTGAHRFKAPLPPPTWQEPFDAVNREISCPQVKIFFPMGKQEQEDCLVASVFTPDTDKTDLPVVVVVHGGGFQVGFGNMFLPKYRVSSHDQIVVTFNYRLGAHGFLCLGTENVPGNAGLKDQLALLRWVQKNIAYFGGNPNDVTITGGSAGSMFVDLIQILPAFQGLFHKVIPESGSSLTPATVQLEPLENARRLARDLNSKIANLDDVYALEDFFTATPYEILMSKAYMFDTNVTMGCTPCIDYGSKEEVMLPDTPYNILKRGNYNKLPILYGYANMEGIMYMQYFEQFKDLMNAKFSDFLPGDLQFDSPEQKQEVAKRVKEFYFGKRAVDDDTMYSYINYFTDIVFAYPTARSVKLQWLAGNKDIYIYEYSFADVDGTPLVYKNLTTSEGASHCDQSFVIYDGKFLVQEEEALSPEILSMKKNLRDLWFNFISTGKPVPEGSPLPAWPPMGADWSPHMSLNLELKLKGSLNLERMRFWEEIYDRHYRSPVPPPAPPAKRSEL